MPNESFPTRESYKPVAESATEAARRCPGFKGLVKKVTLTALPLALAAVAVFNSFAHAAGQNQEPQTSLDEGTAETGDPADPAPQDQIPDADGGEQAPVNLDEELSNSETPWINDGYGEKGMYESEGKSWEYNFANASEVAEVCQNDVRDMIIYTAENQLESFADYLAGLPEALQPEGFKNLSLSKTEATLENLSQKDYEAVMRHFKMVMNSASTRSITIDGEFDNAFMSRKNPDGPFTHENMQLVQSPTYENHLTVTEFCWFDENGNKIGSMIAKITPVFDEQGIEVGFEGCEQIVTKRGTRPHIYDVPPAPAPAPSPENPTPDPEKPQHDPKDTVAQNAAAGPLTPMGVDPDQANSEAEHEKQEAINRYEIYAQAAALAQEAAISEEVAKATEDAMAAAERNIAKANDAANDAANAAATEAAIEQTAANAETVRQQANAAANAAAQDAANKAAAAQAPSNNSGLTARDFQEAAREMDENGG